MANIKFSALPASSTITGAETTVGLQSGAAVQFSPYTTQSVGDASLNLATDAFVANAIAFVNPASSVNEATTTVLPNTPTYNNGTAGVGATLTAGANAALTIDGIAVALNDRVLVKNQASTFQNGVYTQTQVGTGSVPWILTRATDYNTPQNVNYTGTVPVIAGTVNALTNWLLVSAIAAIGSPNAITYVQQTTGGSSGGGGSSNVKGTPPFTKNELMIGLGGNSLGSLGAAGTAQQVLYGGTPPTFGAPVTENTQTSSYQLVLGDSNNLVNMAVTGAATLTIPANASVAFPVGTVIGVSNLGTASLTIAITTDTLSSLSGSALVTGSVILPVGGVVSLLKTGTTAWLLSGSGGSSLLPVIRVVTTGGQVSVSFTPPAAGYTDLIITVMGRSASSSGNTDNIAVQFNSDTTAGHYQWSQLYRSSTSAAFNDDGGSQAYFYIGNIPTTNVSAGQAGSLECTIFSYAGTTFNKNGQSINTADLRTTTTTASGILWPTWLSTAAITSGLIYPASGSGFAANSVVSVWARQ